MKANGEKWKTYEETDEDKKVYLKPAIEDSKKVEESKESK